MYAVNLVEKSWFYRKFNIITHEGLFEVVYNGHGIGYEEVLINGEVACRLTSYLWYVPKFDFLVGSLPSKIEINVWAWLQIRRFNLEIDGESVYSE